jgi:hypothetical protein
VTGDEQHWAGEAKYSSTPPQRDRLDDVTVVPRAVTSQQQKQQQQQSLDLGTLSRHGGYFFADHDKCTEKNMKSTLVYALFLTFLATTEQTNLNYQNSPSLAFKNRDPAQSNRSRKTHILRPPRSSSYHKHPHRHSSLHSKTHCNSLG